jgi:hypothetical protein
MKKNFTFSFLLFSFAIVQAQTAPDPNMSVLNGNFEDATDMAKNANGNWAIKGFFIEELNPGVNFIESGSGLINLYGINNSQAFKVQVKNNSTDNALQVITLSTEPIDISKRQLGKYYLKMNLKVASALLAKRPFVYAVFATDANGNDVTAATCVDVTAERTALNASNDFTSATLIANYQPMYNVYQINANTSGTGGNAKFIRFKLSFGKNCPSIDASTFGTTFYFDDFTLAGPAENTTGINDQISNSSMHIYPNPAKDYVMVNSTDDISEIVVYSTSGAVQKKVLVNSNNYKLDISSLPNGIYVVTAKNSKGAVNQKISKL